MTGISGFVGSHLAEFCIDKHFSVSGIYLFEEELSNIKAIKDDLDLTLCNITDSVKLKETIFRIKPDYIFHLAAKSHVGFSWKDRQDTFSINFMGAVNLLEAVRGLDYKPRVLMVGSAEEYGIVPPAAMPIREDYPLKPTSPYAVSKAAAELLCYQYSNADHLDIVIVRSFSHTGPKQPPTFVCSEFAWQIAKIEAELQEPVIKVGNLEVSRDFCDVRDVVKSYVDLIENALSGEVYNVCSGKAISIVQILTRLCSFSLKKIEVKTDEEKIRKVDLPLLIGDNTKIKKAVGWEATIPIEKILEDLLNYWRRKISKG
ncbi:GDP-mannose 4,6-dehydratase [bacterium]|nr:GDP-mannose 4,6-dehydratase [bacterium]